MGLPFARASFPLSGHDVGSLGRFRLHHAEYQHEYAVLTVNSTAQVYPDLITGTPVVVEWGTADQAETFVGYVVVVQPDASPRQTGGDKLPAGYSLDIHCVGATFPMKEQRLQIFRDMSADQIVSALVQQYQLDVYTETHSRNWGVYSQSGASDWQLMAQLAHDTGYTLVAKNTMVKFHSRLLEVNRGASSALIYDFFKGGSNTVIPDARQILDFAPMLTNMTTGTGKAWDIASTISRARRVVYDLDRRTGATIALEDRSGPETVLTPLSVRPVFTEFVQGLASESLDDAIEWLGGIGEDNRWYVMARALVQGDIRLLPSHLVYFRNLPTDFSGYWYIAGVDHDIQLNPGSGAFRRPAQYTATLTLGRDGFGESVGEPGQLPHRPVDQLADLGLPSNVLTTSQLTSSGYWRSSFLTANRPTN